MAKLRPFSILKRIVVDGTHLFLLESPPYLAFSILKRIVVDGTWTWPGSPGWKLTCFQYPQTDRGRWNDDLRAAFSYEYQAFSILKRIVVDGTDKRQPQFVDTVAFQYPQTDRGRWNFFPVVTPGGELSDFQYPQTDRGRWNIMRAALEYIARMFFQYPQTDRGRWNACAPASCNHNGRVSLSVSSNGSW